jgi:hypothetical protein
MKMEQEKVEKEEGLSLPQEEEEGLPLLQKGEEGGYRSPRRKTRVYF